MSQTDQQTTTVELLTIEQAASKYQIHPQTIRKWIRTGVLKAVRVGPQGRIIRLRRQDLEATD